MAIKRIIILSSAILLAFYSILDLQAKAYEPQKPDYSNKDSWSGYTDWDTFDSSREADIFYIYPTYTSMSVTSSNDTLLYMDVQNERHKRSADQIIGYNHDVFAQENNFNFFGPYYRQITIEVWGMDPISRSRNFGVKNMAEFPDLKEEDYFKVLNVPNQDIIDAFNYYWDNYNKGNRPFILQGDSQGSFVIHYLIKHALTKKQRQMLVAAYASGTTIYKSDLKNKNLKLAKDSIDTGVMICYNSSISLDTKCPLFKNSVYSINPINWKTDSTVAKKEENKGAILGKNRQTGNYDVIKGYAGAYVENGFLIVTDVDAKTFQLSPKELFPFGCLHGGDLKIFAENLKFNMKRRVTAFINR